MLNICYTLFQIDCVILHAHQQSMRDQNLHILAKITLCQSFLLSHVCTHTYVCEDLTVVSICISMMTKDGENSFLDYTMFMYLLLSDACFKYFGNIYVGLYVF